MKSARGLLNTQAPSVVSSPQPGPLATLLGHASESAVYQKQKSALVQEALRRNAKSQVAFEQIPRLDRARKIHCRLCDSNSSVTPPPSPRDSATWLSKMEEQRTWLSKLTGENYDIKHNEEVQKLLKAQYYREPPQTYPLRKTEKSLQLNVPSPTDMSWDSDDDDQLRFSTGGITSFVPPRPHHYRTTTLRQVVPRPGRNQSFTKYLQTLMDVEPHYDLETRNLVSAQPAVEKSSSRGFETQTRKDLRNRAASPNRGFKVNRLRRGVPTPVPSFTDLSPSDHLQPLRLDHHRSLWSEEQCRLNNERKQKGTLRDHDGADGDLPWPRMPDPEPSSSRQPVTEQTAAYTPYHESLDRCKRTLTREDLFALHNDRTARLPHLRLEKSKPPDELAKEKEKLEQQNQARQWRDRFGNIVNVVKNNIPPIKFS